jgi:hypothetical protein
MQLAGNQSFNILGRDIMYKPISGKDSHLALVIGFAN